jgi:hypothetical protein
MAFLDKTIGLGNSRSTKQLELFALRSFSFADRVDSGEIKFLDAVDVLYDGAVTSGLVDAVGDDVVQTTLAAAFATVRDSHVDRRARRTADYCQCEETAPGKAKVATGRVTS